MMYLLFFCCCSVVLFDLIGFFIYFVLICIFERVDIILFILIGSIGLYLDCFILILIWIRIVIVVDLILWLKD